MYQHSIDIRVRYGETDQMGYLYYGFYALYYEQGRTEAIRNLGVTYKELEENGIIMPVASMESKYLRPAHYDDLVKVVTTVKELPTGPFITFHTELFNAQNKLMNIASVTLAFYDPINKSKVNAPEYLIEKLRPYFK